MAYEWRTVESFVAYGNNKKTIEKELSFLQFRSGIAYMVIPFFDVYNVVVVTFLFIRLFAHWLISKGSDKVGSYKGGRKQKDNCYKENQN